MNRPLLPVLALLLALLVPATARAGLPFGPGEKLSYDIYWTFVLAGSATLETLDSEPVDGAPALRYRALARSTPFVDKFYKVRDSIEAWTDAGVTRSLLYKKDQSEGDYVRNYLVSYDQYGITAYRYSKGAFKNALSIPRGSFDPLSMLFCFRSRFLKPGEEFAAPVTDGEKVVMGRAKAIKYETISTKAGEFDTVLIEPDVRDIGGVFRKSPNATLQIWFSNDARRIPVRVRSRVLVGYFSMELTGYEAPKQKAAH